MEKTLKRKREQDHFSMGSAKKARRSSSPDLKENHEYDHSREESCGNILATMSEEFLDLYDDLDDWGQDYCAPEEERIKFAASEYSDSNVDGVADEEYLTDMDSYDDLEECWEEDRIYSKSLSNSESELSGNDGETCERGKTEDEALCDDTDVIIAEMKERIKEKKGIIQAWQLDDFKKRYQKTATIQMIRR